MPQAAIVAALLLNARYVPLSLAVASIFPGSRRRRVSRVAVDRGRVVGTRRRGAAGSSTASSIGVGPAPLRGSGSAAQCSAPSSATCSIPEAIGLDAAFPALFLALLAPYLRSRRALADRARRRCDHARADAGRAARRADRRRQPRRTAGTASMTWLVIAVVGVHDDGCSRPPARCCSASRQLPSRVAAVVDVLAPAMLAALVVTQTVGGDREIVVDAAARGRRRWRRSPSGCGRRCSS